MSNEANNRTRPLANISPPGAIIQRELDARGWTQVDLADVLGRPVQVINEIIAGKKSITADTAKGLAQAFGNSDEVWMNLEAQWQLSLAKPASPDVALRAKVFSKGPIKELLRRGWILPGNSAQALADNVPLFYEITSLDDEATFAGYAARQSTPYTNVLPGQTAWLFGAKGIAKPMKVTGKFSPERLNWAISQLQSLLRDVDGVGEVSEILTQAGIRFLILEPLPQTRIDGAVFWLSEDEPVVVVSFRYDRIDYFWHTLMHELAHLDARDGIDNSALDIDLVGTQAARPLSRPPHEIAADAFAVEKLIPQVAVEVFIARSRPFYSRQKILSFAAQVDVHPGILVGQLQYRGEIQYSHSRDLLVKVRARIIDSAVTDGWGRKAHV